MCCWDGSSANLGPAFVDICEPSSTSGVAYSTHTQFQTPPAASDESLPTIRPSTLHLSSSGAVIRLSMDAEHNEHVTHDAVTEVLSRAA